MVGSMLSRVGRASRLARKLGTFLFALAVTLAVASRAMATEPPPLELPDSGVDLPGIIELAVAEMGTVAAAAILGFVAFLIIRKGLSWIRRAI